MFENLLAGVVDLNGRILLFPLAFMKVFAFFQFFPVPAIGTGFKGHLYLLGIALSITAALLASEDLLLQISLWSKNDYLYYGFLSYLYGLLLCAPFVICLRAVTIISDFIEGFVNNIAAPTKSELLQDEVTSFGQIVGMFIMLQIIDEPYFNAITVLVFWQDFEVLMLFSDWNIHHVTVAMSNIDFSLIYTLFKQLLPLFGVVTVLELLGILVSRFLPEFNMFVFLFPIKYVIGLFLLSKIASLIVKEVTEWVREYGAVAGV